MILTGQLRAYGSLVMPETNSAQVIGGPIDLTTAVDFSDLSSTGQLQVVSSSSLDVALNVTVYGRLANGIINNEIVILQGQTPVPTIQNAWQRLMKAVKAGTSSGDIAVEQVVPFATGVIPQVWTNPNQVVLDYSASNIDGYYIGLVIRFTSGTGQFTIAKILEYNGSNHVATLDKVVTVGSSTGYRLSNGILFNKSPNEILTVRRPFYGAAASSPGGVDLNFYEKFFWRNDSSLLLTYAYVFEALNPTGAINFAIDPTIPSVSTSFNRITPPAIPLSFSRNPQQIPSGDLALGESVGVWLNFPIKAGQASQQFSYMSALSGQTI